MRRVSGLNVSEELKERIEQVAREREENPSSLISSALDLLLETEALQAAEANRRLALSTGKTVPNEQVMAWLDTWGLTNEIPPPECK